MFNKIIEDVVIIFMCLIALSLRWSAIAARLPGRTDNEIKNYWNSHLKKKLVINHRKATNPPSASGALITSTNNSVKPYQYHSSTATSMDADHGQVLTQPCSKDVKMPQLYSQEVAVAHNNAEARPKLRQTLIKEEADDVAPKSSPPALLDPQPNVLHCSANSAFLMDHNKILNEDHESFWYNLLVNAGEPSRSLGN